MSEKELTAEEIEAMMNQEQQQRAEACYAEISAILTKHNCDLLPSINIIGAEITYGFVVRPLSPLQ